MNSNDVVHIAFALYDRDGEYSSHTATTMMSIMDNTNANITFHILHDETLSLENRERFISMVHELDREIHFHKVEISKINISNKILKLFSRGTLFRLYLTSILKNEEKVIYMDSDIICNFNINKLWKIDIKEYFLAAVLEENEKEEESLLSNISNFMLKKVLIKKGFYDRVKIRNQYYFNAGVLFFNLKKIREIYDLERRSIEFFLKHPDAPYADQDCLNYLFQKECLFLDEKFNKSVEHAYLKEPENYTCEQTWEGICWHFKSPKCKPWKVSIYPVDELYWKYFKMTPWGYNIKDFINRYKKTVVPLEEALLTYSIKRRRMFLINIFKRLIREFSDKWIN